MASKVFACAVVALLIVTCLSASPIKPAPGQSDRSIVLISDHDRLREAVFTDDDFARVQRDPGYVLEKMRLAGVTCCGDRKRITQYLWVCCDGNRIRATNQTLVRALEQVWGI